MDDHIRFTFHGRFDISSFKAFADHRAGRLGIDLMFGPCSRASCEMTVRGQGVLVDAFEMAMSLGPIDCVVFEVKRQAAPEMAA